MFTSLAIAGNFNGALFRRREDKNCNQSSSAPIGTRCVLAARLQVLAARSRSAGDSPARRRKRCMAVLWTMYSANPRRARRPLTYKGRKRMPLSYIRCSSTPKTRAVKSANRYRTSGSSVVRLPVHLRSSSGTLMLS